MNLQKISYVEHSNTDKCWEFQPFEISKINLIVGKNASGKTRLLKSIHSLSKILISQKVPFSTSNYIANFNIDNETYNYQIKIENRVVQCEELKINDKTYLKRNNDGTGEIWGIELNKFIKFKIPDNHIAISRRDEEQHPFLECLFNWAINIRLFKFTQDRDKTTLVVQNENFSEDPKDLFVLKIFQKGKTEFKSKFTSAILKNMNEIGYNLEYIKIDKMSDITLNSPYPTELSGLVVKEVDCPPKINQVIMSDGMFRALAIFIHFNYYKMKRISGAILIDDIGEGLDFERSSKLIKRLVKDAKSSNIQLIMSTNDKFVMNSIPLDYWQVLSRNGGSIKIFNKKNSNEKFEEFKFTGLNNFDFFSSDYINNNEE